jgi:hypothetical protein
MRIGQEEAAKAGGIAPKSHMLRLRVPSVLPLEIHLHSLKINVKNFH